MSLSMSVFWGLEIGLGEKKNPHSQRQTGHRKVIKSRDNKHTKETCIHLS